MFEMRPAARAAGASLRAVRWASAALVLAVAATASTVRADLDPRYPWATDYDAAATLAARVPPPPGFVREPVPAGSFAAFLRGLPMKPAGAPVRLHTGALKPRQDVHAAVIEIDVGTKNLQQCADAIMRLRAEWLYSRGRAREIGFTFTGGARVPFFRWSRGERPSPDGRRWSTRAKADASYASFRRYLEQVFIYAGTHSLSRELKAVGKSDMPQIGDVFIKGGFPGHAVLVADLVRNPTTGERRLLLLQSYMPAQDIHVLKNPRAAPASPWYPTNLAMPLVTPEWTFQPGSLRRWP